MKIDGFRLSHHTLIAQHLPQFFSPRKQARTTVMDPRKKLRRKPKLERRNAHKDFEYDADGSSRSSKDSFYSGDGGDDGGSRYTRSMDFHDRTSFRIEGIEGEFDRICQRLGLSGPDDFAIPAAAWEAIKVRSSSDILPRLKHNKLDDRQKEEAKGNDIVEGELGEKRDDRVRDEPAETSGCCTADSGGDGVCAGINGFRPPMLKPPPGTRVPMVDNTCSTWDLLRDFAPQGEGHSLSDSESEDEHDERREALKEEGGGGGEVGGGGGVSPKREEEEGADDNAAAIAEIVAELSGSCVFTTSNEDDTSSTTTGPRSNNISPNGRIKRIITTGNWEKGDLLGRGSFGSVYEGIAE